MPIFTIGHSNHAVEHLLSLLTQHGIECVADVRSQPYSRYASQFNKRDLENSLKTQALAYEYMGRELGGKKPFTNRAGKGNSVLQEATGSRFFQQGSEKLTLRAKKGYRIAIMCAEKDPYHCHRFVLISPQLVKRGIQVKHILEDGSLLSHVILEKQMLKEFYPEWNSPTLFEQPKTFEEAVMIAYERKFRKMIDS